MEYMCKIGPVLRTRVGAKISGHTGGLPQDVPTKTGVVPTKVPTMVPTKVPTPAELVGTPPLAGTP